MTSTILGSFEAEKNGKRIKYRIQTVTEDCADAVLLHMSEYYALKEPLCAYSKIKEDPISFSSLYKLWKSVVYEGTAIAALLENDNGEPEKLVGVNLTCISTKEENDIVEEGELFNKILDVVKDFMSSAHIYEKYGIDSYLSAWGLSVHPDYHGFQIGLNLLKSREPLSKILGLKVTGTVFSAGASQHLAKKLGYETLAEVEYSNIDVAGEYYFKDMEKVTNEKKMTYQAYEYK